MKTSVTYKPNLETHIPHGLSKKYFNCKVCGQYRSPGKYAGVWTCCEETPCPCCLRGQLKEILETNTND